ncbi:N-acetylglucosamine kinase-like BadF-type ATPase [Nonomuraea thailandensis]|uniref:N-acetylglucosamine kinase-like BadF-type ATPase n=1 Tax=Nonomuraea thailandensis TaxID=1188745 RepID=A0A9X2GNJ8_9ACTN|nr:BadF/BadG/BcrA/BcrD ATPase family protein [Nonomuraea thailandensis]MCP2361010.1 N-acetylglucosamine kinase-like BadF-type ATPase [Nonomuraea thailandensis]
MRLVLGVDAGGTSSRAALFTVAGAPVGRGCAGGGNPGALGRDQAAAHLTAAVRAALEGVAPAQVESVVVGIAGSPEACAELVEQVFRPVLPGVPVSSVGDIVTAFAAGTAAVSGSVLISGTGAIAAKIIGHRAVATADGFGWQLGDEGSAFWLGRAAARATIRALASAPGDAAGHGSVTGDGLAAGHGSVGGDGLPAGHGEVRGEGQGGLLALVVEHLLPDGLGADPVARLAAAVHARPPLALAELAPLVSRAAAAGDPAAVKIVREAAARLVATLRGVHDSGPAVLAGSVLTSDGPVRQAVTELLAGTTVSTAGDTAGAAAWLAARAVSPAAQAEALHAAFTTTG